MGNIFKILGQAVLKYEISYIYFLGGRRKKNHKKGCQCPYVILLTLQMPPTLHTFVKLTFSRGISVAGNIFERNSKWIPYRLEYNPTPLKS